MGERAQKVVIRDGIVSKYFAQWGGQHCADELLGGAGDFNLPADSNRPESDWMDPVFAEGGYLVDFDRQRILLYSWDQAYLETALPLVERAWPQWIVEKVDEGVPEFKRYVETRTV
jgi:hypothetical protein